MMPPKSEDGTQGKIALEEHFATEATVGDSQVFAPQVWDTLRPRLLDIQDIRLREMDRHGVEMMILSLNAPAVQAIPDVKRAIAVAREANDVLADNMRRGPGRLPVSRRWPCRTRKPPPPSSRAASTSSAWWA